HALATAPCLGDVLALDLNGVPLTPQAFSLLLSNPHLRQVTCLDLSNNDLGDAELIRLLDWPGFRNVARLDLRNNRLTSDAATALLRAAGPRLCWLDLHGNPLNDPARQAVAAWQCKHSPAHQGDTPRRVVNSVGIEFARVPSGEFLMGSPKEEAFR